MENKKLRLSQDNKLLAGVCGGIGEFFEIDPTIIRLIVVIISVALGSALMMVIIMYFFCWAIIPSSNIS